MKYAYKIRLVSGAILLILFIAGITGLFLPLKIFDLQFGALAQRVFVDFSLVTLAIFCVLILITALSGRFYCSLLCPLGLMQEFFALIIKKKNKKTADYPFKYFLAAAAFGMLTGSSALLLRHLEPYTLFGSAFTLSAYGISALAVIFVLVFFKNRFFCTNICPAGAVLGLISKFSPYKIQINKDKCVSCGMCEKNCPSGCIDSKEKTLNNSTCIRCLKCLDICPKGGITLKKVQKEEVKFSPERRRVIIGTAAVIFFGAMVKTGLALKDKIAHKLKNIILPPGAVSEERFINKCYNCNLCVKNCPNKIIKKADENFNAVHIDYSNGFCKYDCNICSQICPAGAIKRISKEEKQKTRIAMAMINTEKCAQCGKCAIACPTHAIINEEGKPPVLNAQKCIGCGACKNACPSGAIEIYSIKEQKVI